MHKLIRVSGRATLIAAAVGAAVYGGSVAAQEGAAASEKTGTSSALVLEEVTVTAQKREENLQSTPIAIMAIGAEALDRAGVREFNNLDKLVPDVRIQRSVNTERVAIRGVFATNESPSSESPNAVHIDGVYLPKASALGGVFFDVDRIEVLKGPQGTLYGRNANGGAINIISRRPEKEFGASGQIEVGNYDLLRTEGEVNAPFSDTFSTRLAFADYRHGGYYDNGLEDAGEQSARLSTLWTPDDKQKLLFIFDTEKLNNSGYGITTVVEDVNPNVAINVPRDWSLSQIYPTPNSYYHSNQYGVMAQYDYSFEPATLTVQGAYRHQSSNDFLLATGYSLVQNPPITGPFTGELSGGAGAHSGGFNMTTLEARLASSSTHPLEWVVGMFGMRETDTGFIENYGSVPSSLAVEPNIRQGNPYQKALAYGVFGQATYTPAALERLHVTAGVRYNYDDKEAITTTSGFLAPKPDDYFSGSDTWDAVTWRGAVAFDVTDQSMVYTSVSRGYKAGGFAFAPYHANPEYKPEYVKAYEIGTKNRFFNDRLQVNMEAFYMDYTDLSDVLVHLDFVPGQAPVISIGIGNGAATYKGATLDTIALLTQSDRVNLSLAYLKAERGQFDGRSQGGDWDLSNTRILGTPEWTANAAYSHTWSVFGGELNAEVAAQFRDKMITGYTFTNLPNQIVTYTDSMLRWDFSLRYAPEEAKWNVSAYVHNLNNRLDYFTRGYDQGGQFITGVPMPPRTYGVIVGAKF